MRPQARTATTATQPSQLFVNEEPGWAFHHPLPTSQALTTLFVLNGQLQVGGVRGVRYTSADGTAWAPLPALSQNNIVGYAFGDGRHRVGVASADLERDRLLELVARGRRPVAKLVDLDPAPRRRHCVVLGVDRSITRHGAVIRSGFGVPKSRNITSLRFAAYK